MNVPLISMLLPKLCRKSCAGDISDLHGGRRIRIAETVTPRMGLLVTGSLYLVGEAKELLSDSVFDIRGSNLDSLSYV